MQDATVATLTSMLRSYRAEVAASAPPPGMTGELRADNRSLLQRFWGSVQTSLRDRKPLIADPLATHEVQIGGQTYQVADMNVQAGVMSELAGNLYHRSPLGSIVEGVGQWVYDPWRKANDSIDSSYNTIANLPHLPQTWEALPDYKKRDLVVNMAVGTALTGGYSALAPEAEVASVPTYEATLGNSTSTKYQRTFFAAHPELEHEVVVHHAVEQQVLTKYPGVVNTSEMHSLENLRGIPNQINNDIHLSKIRVEWNRFYKKFDTNGTMPTQAELLQKATEIDRKYGSQFRPPVGGSR